MEVDKKWEALGIGDLLPSPSLKMLQMNIIVMKR